MVIAQGFADAQARQTTRCRQRVGWVRYRVSWRAERWLGRDRSGLFTSR
ncbi:MAG: hypothetical protein ACK5QW_00450 [Cyanobacteriota bacterium]